MTALSHSTVSHDNKNEERGVALVPARRRLMAVSFFLLLENRKKKKRLFTDARASIGVLSRVCRTAGSHHHLEFRVFVGAIASRDDADRFAFVFFSSRFFFSINMFEKKLMKKGGARHRAL